MGLLFGLVALGVIGFLAWQSDDESATREIWLINGKRYTLAIRLNSPGFDVSMFPGFCEFSAPSIVPFQSDRIPGGAGTAVTTYEVQFTAQWCAQNTLWTVPEHIAIGEV